jgi:hypothetical protein
VRMVSRDACAPVKCSRGAAILTIQWFDGADDDRSFSAGVFGDLPNRRLQRALDDV